MIRRRFYRSSAIIATSLAAMVPKPYVKAATKKEKKETRAATVAKSAQKPAAAGDPPWLQSTTSAASILNQSGVNQPFTPLIPSPYGPITPLGPTKPAPTVPRMVLTDKGPYPWRENIVTTTFWIGETAAKNNPVPNDKSSWDVNWARNYGGTDSPDKLSRSGYVPVAFTPGQNPFYVALPYNDLQAGGHKPEASQVIPWFKREYKGSGKSVLKGRWIAIRFKDRVAYAQWEDCGPFRTDHFAYVFGDERPKPNLNKGAGLDVSPAVRDFLGMASTDVTDWKFVEFEEVPRGPWSTHGENNTFVLKDRIDTIRVAEAEKLKPTINPSSQPAAD